jgi:hypothetical protein
MKQTGISITEAEASQEPSLWVVNLTKNTGVTFASDILLTINTSADEIATVIVPFSWLPFDLANQAPRSDIIKSLSFRKAVNFKQLAIVDDKTAKQLLARPGADDEELRLENLNNNRVEDILHKEQQQAQRDFGKDIAEKAKERSRTFSNIPEEEIGVNPRCIQVMHEATDQRSAQTNLKVIAASLNKIDFNYVKNFANKKSWFKIAKACERKIEKLELEEDAYDLN